MYRYIEFIGYYMLINAILQRIFNRSNFTKSAKFSIFTFV